MEKLIEKAVLVLWLFALKDMKMKHIFYGVGTSWDLWDGMMSGG